MANGAVFSHCPRLAEIAHAAVSGGAVTLAISNTIPTLHIDVDAGRATLGTGYGGLALAHKAAQAVSAPIIG